MTPQNHKPTLSIVMPFYNHGDLVAFMIDSIIANDFQDWELLAIDDGSDIETLQALRKYESEKRIKFIKRGTSPKGAQTCRNIGLEKALGKYIVFFDSDDYVAPYCLGNRVMLLDKRKELDFMVFPSGTYRENHFLKNTSPSVYGYNIYENDIKAFASKQLPFIVWNNIYRKQSLIEHGLFWDENLFSLQDADFNLQAILAGLKYDYAICDADYGYRTEERGGSISNKISSNQHLASHIYHLKKNIKSIQKKYGHSLDIELHQGLLRIYNQTMPYELNLNFTQQLLALEKQYGMKTYFLFHLQVTATNLLNYLLPAKRARQIPMAVFLICRLLKQRKKMARIRTLLNKANRNQ